jgi:aspartate aminotransferase
MIHMLATKEPLELHGYSPSLGITSVREAIAENLEKRFGLPYRKEHIFMASGAAGALAHAFRLVTEPGDEILTFAPFFPEYHPYVDLTGAVLKVVPPNLENFQIFSVGQDCQDSRQDHQFIHELFKNIPV